MTAGVRERQAGAVGASWKALATRFALAVFFGLFLAVAGVGTGIRDPFVLRLAALTTVSVAATAIGSGLIWLTRHWKGRRWSRILVVCLGMTTPMGLYVWAMDLVLAKTPPAVADLPAYELTSLAISLSMGVLFWLGLARFGRAPASLETGTPQAGPVRFLERLPLKLRGAEIWAVCAEDHYLRVHTSKGQDLILLRLSDAIAELDGLEGAQTHRSWWVARAAIADAKRGDGRAVIALPDGAEAPVSRTHVKTLRAAGWI